MLLHDWRYKQNKIDQFSKSKNRNQNNPIEQSKIHKSSTHIPRLVAEKTDKAKKKKNLINLKLTVVLEASNSLSVSHSMMSFLTLWTLFVLSLNSEVRSLWVFWIQTAGLQASWEQSSSTQTQTPLGKGLTLPLYKVSQDGHESIETDLVIFG